MLYCSLVRSHTEFGSIIWVAHDSAQFTFFFPLDPDTKDFFIYPEFNTIPHKNGCNVAS
jgi:hypothetical protein